MLTHLGRGLGFISCAACLLLGPALLESGGVPGRQSWGTGERKERSGLHRILNHHPGSAASQLSLPPATIRYGFRRWRTQHSGTSGMRPAVKGQLGCGHHST